MKTLALVLAFAAVAAAQKPLKKHKPAYIATSPGGGLHGGDIGGGAQYQSAPQSGHHGGFQSQGFNSGIGKNAKATYPLLLSDTRTLNSDGTINFNYQADNGLQQGETVDNDGTRRGFYSYPGADGKLITVKYTAGKNGFVAEGDHLPTQPQSAPYNEKENHDLYSPKQGSHHGGQQHRPAHHGGHHGGHQAAHHGGFGGAGAGHYSAPSHHGGSGAGHYSAPVTHHGGAGQYKGAGAGAGAGGNYYSHSSFGGAGGGAGSGAFANFPDFSSQFSGGHQGGTPSYSSGAGRYSGAGASGHPGGAGSYSSLGHGGQGGGHGHHGASSPDFGNLGASPYSGPMYTSNNPYQPQQSGPVNAGFDLGNGGHFSINFSPGVGQEYNPSGGDYSGGQSGGSQGGHGGQGRY